MGHDGGAAEALRLDILELFAEAQQWAPDEAVEQEVRPHALGFNAYSKTHYASPRLRNRYKKRRYRRDGRDNFARQLGLTVGQVTCLRPEEFL